jgi:DUF1707 SHOCT-like domain/2TM domain
VAHTPHQRDQIRPSEHARRRAGAALREHYADGRLDDVELERRVELAYAARSRGELKALFRDLPWDPRSRDRYEGFWRFQRNLFRAHGVTYVGINALLVGIWAATGQGGFWPAGSIAGWGAAFGAHWMVVRAMRKSRREHEQRRLAAPSRARRALSR